MRGRIESFKYAFQGLFTAFREEPNFRFHVVAMIGVVSFGGYLELERLDWLILTLTIGAVLCVELLNTAIENICDHINPERHPVIKKIKDVAAAAVLVSAFMAFIVAILIFGPHLISG